MERVQGELEAGSGRIKLKNIIYIYEILEQ